MMPEPHVCCVCKSVVVWTDCLPAVCGPCLADEREERERRRMPEPDVVAERPPPGDATC
jgi:hypothetical protein